MGIVILIARLVLAAVFAVAGIAKLADERGSKKSLRDFGLPEALAGTVAMLLPVAELMCAVALLWRPYVVWGAEGAAALLAIFMGGIAVTLAKGKAPDCHCFGQLSSSPVSRWTLARNAVLLGMALLVMWRGVEDRVGWRMDSRTGLLLGISAVLAAGLAGTIWLLLHMLKQNGRLLMRLEAVEKKLGIDPNAVVAPGLAVGTAAPELRLAALDGRTVTGEMLAEGGRAMLLVFSELGCGACDVLMPDVAKWQREFGERVRIAVVSGGALEANAAKAAQHGLEQVYLQAGREVSEAFKVTATPSAVLVAEGKVGSALATGPEEIRKLVTRSTLPAPAKKGDLVPTLKLEGLDGGVTDLRTLRRKLVLFWNPGCGYCQAMIEDVKKFDGPGVVIISGGTAEANRAQRFRSTVLLDPEWSAGSVLGAGGTPSALLIDEEGRVASEVGVGAPAVLAMAGVAK